LFQKALWQTENESLIKPPWHTTPAMVVPFWNRCGFLWSVTAKYWLLCEPLPSCVCCYVHCSDPNEDMCKINSWKELSDPPSFNRLHVQYYPCSIWPPVLSLNITYILLILLITFQRTWPIETPDIPSSKYHVHFPLLRSLQKIHPSSRPWVTFGNMLVFMVASYWPLTQPQSLTTHCLLSISENSIYLQLPLHVWRPAMLWWQGAHLDGVSHENYLYSNSEIIC
jgi:hypothetical protein